MTVELTLNDAVATVTIARASKLNALDRNTGKLLLEVFGSCDMARAVILTGTTEVFSAGADLNEPFDDPEDSRLWEAIHRRLSELPSPTIAAIEGYCLGGGLVLAAWCDLRVAGKGARFGTPEVRHGLIAGTGGTQVLPRLIGVPRAKQLLLVGDQIDAQTAYTWGLVNWVVADGCARQRANEIALDIAGSSASAVRATKQLVDAGRDLDLFAALELEHQRGRVIAVSGEAKEGIRAFLARPSHDHKDDE